MIWGFDDETPKRKTREELLAAIPDNVREAALAKLSTPDLLTWIMESIEVCGVAADPRPSGRVSFSTR